MAAIYDPQGNIIGDDGGPTLDQMNLELSKQNRLTPQQVEKFVAPQSLASQIPGYGKPVPPSQTPPDPLGSAAGNFTELATKFNPLMMAKSMREAAGIITVPAVAAVKGVGESLTTSPAGTFTSGKAPAYAEKVATQFMQQNAPQTPMAQEFTSAIAPYMADLPAYLGHLQTGRPAFTPNDLRVIGAEATRVGRQVKDIPTDFVNAQSGLQKLDPITGQPTYGAKLQGVADSVGDIMAQREMQGLPPIPGLPASMQPTNPKLYAMRPIGSRVTSATLPETAKPDAATYMPAQEIIRNVIDSSTITPVQALDEIVNNILRKPEAASARRAFESFLKQKANEMYPDAPSEGAALAAYKAKFGDKEASAAHSLEMYDEFLQTPKGMQYRTELALPSAEELPAMHEAASNWLNSQFTNYLIEKVGTPNEPAAKLASQGLTFYPPSEIFNSVDMSGSLIGAKRIAAGMPAKTPTDEALVAADQQLLELVQQAADAATRKREQEAIAQQLGYGAVDPNTGVVPEGMNLGRYEPFAQASRESDKANAAYKKQQKANDNLRLGSAYENATDKAIHAPFAKSLKEEIEYRERQFYPALMQTPDAERAYIANPVQLRNLGFEDLAKSFYSDVMSGKIPLDKVKSTTVEKYIRKTAEGRIAEEKIAQAKEKQFKVDADTQFAKTASLYIPNDKVFGNVGALEITNRFTPEQVAQLVSEDTLALDVCIGEGGNVVDKPNPWHPGTGNRQYIPIYNIVTGQRDPDATSPRGAYINAVAQGSQMVSFRDTVTGEPVAIFDFNPTSSGKYDINFASGRKNGAVKTEYVEGIKSYLNSREGSIRGVSDKMTENLDIYDSKRMTNRALAASVNMPVSRFEKYDLSGMPRFVTNNDVRSYIDAIKATEPQVPVPAVMSQRPSESLEAYLTGAVSSAIDNVLDLQRRAFDEAGEGNDFGRSEVFFAGIRNDFVEALAMERFPTSALEGITQQLYDLESQYANSNRVADNTIAEGIQDLISDLNAHAEYARIRQVAESAQLRTAPRAAVERGDLMPNMDTTELLIEYRDRLSPAQVDWLQDFAERWEANVDDSPAGQGIGGAMIDEFARWRDNNTLLPEGRPDYLRMTHDAALAADRQWGVQTADEVRAALRFISEGRGEIDGPLDPANDTDAYIRALRQQADAAVNGSAEIVLNELADEMESAYMRDWEPADEQPPARRPQPFDWVGALDSLVNEVSQNTNPGVGNRVDTIAHRVAERTNPRLDPAGYAAALRAVDFANEHVVVGLALRQLALAVEAEIIEQQPAQPRQTDLAAARQQEIIDMVNNPDLNPDDLRATALLLEGVPDQHWMSLSEENRREAVQFLRQRANYGEFNPRDFAVRLANEADLDFNELRDTILALNDGVFDHEVLRGLPPIEQGRAAQATAIELQRNMGEQAQAPVDVTPAERNDAYDIATGLDNSYYQGADSPQQALAMVNQHLSMLRDRPLAGYNAIVGLERDTYVYSPALIQALITELELIYTAYRDRIAEGNAEGGPVRGYQKGGTVKKPEVKTPYLFSVPTYSETVAYEMYPGQLGQNDQRDAARHMLAAGTLSRKYGPKTAEFLGKAHEFTTSPLQSVKSMFTGKMPADYDMDTHNNRFGAELGQRAKSQAELEDLVQAEAERASRTQTPDKAFIKKANGGIVQENPTTDQMRYALTMRRK